MDALPIVTPLGGIYIYKERPQRLDHMDGHRLTTQARRQKIIFKEQTVCDILSFKLAAN